MKKRAFALLLAAVLAAGSVTGCESAEETVNSINLLDGEYDEATWIKAIKAYEKLDDEVSARKATEKAAQQYPNSTKIEKYEEKLFAEAPEPNKEPGEYEGAVRLVFENGSSGEEKLIVLVNRELTEEELKYSTELQSDYDNGLYVYECPDSEGFNVDLFTAGSNRVKAYYMKGRIGRELVRGTQFFEGEYMLTGADFSDFGFVRESENAREVSFTGTNGGKVYYTTDGTDPLFCSVVGANLTGGSGIAWNGESLTLPVGTNVIKARCIAENGLISPLIEENFDVSIVFDSASERVTETGTYEYICGPDIGIKRYAKNGESKRLETVLDKRTDGIAVINDTFYFTPTNGRVLHCSIRDGEANMHFQFNDDWNYCKVVGEGWLWRSILMYEDQYAKIVRWERRDIPQVGTEEVAKKATLMNRDIALWCKDQQVYACDVDGSNERVLWTEEGFRLQLDAITDKVVLYHYTARDNKIKHMVYDLRTGERRVNRAVEENRKVLGYTTNAVYMENGASLDRKAIDYDTL